MSRFIVKHSIKSYGDHYSSVTYTVGDDTTAPGDVSGFTATPGPGQITLAWTNPTDMILLELCSVTVRMELIHKTRMMDHPFQMAMAEKLPDRRVRACPIHTLIWILTKSYYYSAFSYDTSNNYSQTAYASATPLPPATPNQPPEIVSFTAMPSSLDNPGESTTFNVSATDPDGDPLTYIINFGDGTANGSGSQVVHTYEAGAGEPPYIYTAIVTVSDGNGNSVQSSLDVTVNDIPPAKPKNVSVN